MKDEEEDLLWLSPLCATYGKLTVPLFMRIVLFGGHLRYGRDLTLISLIRKM